MRIPVTITMEASLRKKIKKKAVEEDTTMSRLIEDAVIEKFGINPEEEDRS